MANSPSRIIIGLMAGTSLDGLNHQLKTIADLNINLAAKEAILFALLANECIAGENQLIKQT